MSFKVFNATGFKSLRSFFSLVYSGISRLRIHLHEKMHVTFTFNLFVKKEESKVPFTNNVIKKMA